MKSEEIKEKELKSETISAKVSPAIKKRLDDIARKKDRNISYIVNQILTNHFVKCA